MEIFESRKKFFNFFFEMNTLFNWSFSFLPIGDCITKRLVKKREEKEWFLNFHMYYIYTTFFLPSLQYIRKIFRPSSIISPSPPNSWVYYSNTISALCLSTYFYVSADYVLVLLLSMMRDLKRFICVASLYCKDCTTIW